MKKILYIQEFSRTPESIQGQQDVFQESRTKRALIANSKTILGAQGRLATLQGSPNFFVRGPHKLLLNSPCAGHLSKCDCFGTKSTNFS